MGNGRIEKPKREYTSKTEVMLFIDSEEIVTEVQVQAELGLTVSAVRGRMYRLWRQGLIEPLGIEAGKWVLSPRGIRYVEYLKQKMGESDDQETED
jgi:hypothetical protein